MRNLIDILCGCRCRTYSFPITTDPHKGAYVVCLNCGKEFSYSITGEWKRGLPLAVRNVA